MSNHNKEEEGTATLSVSRVEEEGEEKKKDEGKKQQQQEIVDDMRGINLLRNYSTGKIDLPFTKTGTGGKKTIALDLLSSVHQANKEEEEEDDSYEDEEEEEEDDDEERGKRKSRSKPKKKSTGIAMNSIGQHRQARKSKPRSIDMQKSEEESVRSQYRGVSYDRRMQMWRCKANAVHIGFFTTEVEAAKAYDQAKIALHKGKGSLALNFPLLVPEGAGIAHSTISAITSTGGDNRSAGVVVVVDNKSNNKDTLEDAPRTSQFRGVMWDTGTRSWRSKIKLKSKTWYLGVFSNEIEAARAYDTAAIFIQRDRTSLNFPDTDYSTTPLPRKPPKWVCDILELDENGNPRASSSSSSKLNNTSTTTTTIDSSNDGSTPVATITTTTTTIPHSKKRKATSTPTTTDITAKYVKGDVLILEQAENWDDHNKEQEEGSNETTSSSPSSSRLLYGVRKMTENDDSKVKGKFEAFLEYEYHRIHLGFFSTSNEAEMAHDIASLKLYPPSMYDSINLNCTRDKVPVLQTEYLPESLERLAGKLSNLNSTGIRDRQMRAKSKINGARAALHEVRELYKMKREEDEEDDDDDDNDDKMNEDSIMEEKEQEITNNKPSSSSQPAPRNFVANLAKLALDKFIQAKNDDTPTTTTSKTSPSPVSDDNSTSNISITTKKDDKEDKNIT